MSLLKRVCKLCGPTFEGGPNAFYCPDCRAIHKRELRQSLRRQESGRQIGSLAPCNRCGEPYLVKSGSHKYCAKCAKENIREKRVKATSVPRAPVIRPTRPPKEPKITTCVVCGKQFKANGHITCSPTCRLLRLQQKSYVSYEDIQKLKK